MFDKIVETIRAQLFFTKVYVKLPPTPSAMLLWRSLPVCYMKGLPVGCYSTTKLKQGERVEGFFGSPIN